MLSEDVQSYIEVLDREREKDLPHDFGGKTAQLLRLLVSYFVESRETILPDLPLDFETLLGEPTVEGLLDDRFTREAVDSVSGYVNRTLRLSRMKALQTPSRVTNTYLREAARTYVLGLPQA